MTIRAVAMSLLFVFAVASCGASEAESSTASAVEQPQTEDSAGVADTAPADDTATTGQDVADEVIENAEDFADDLVDDLEQAQEVSGGGSATLTVGDQTWTFAPVLCAFGEEETGQVDAEFVLSALQDGKQMYFSIDRYGHSASLNDIKDFENPSVSLGTLFLEGEEIIKLDGKSFSGSADFYDDTTDGLDFQPGTFSGTCP